MGFQATGILAAWHHLYIDSALGRRTQSIPRPTHTPHRVRSQSHRKPIPCWNTQTPRIDANVIYRAQSQRSIYNRICIEPVVRIVYTPHIYQPRPWVIYIITKWVCIVDLACL